MRRAFTIQRGVAKAKSKPIPRNAVNVDGFNPVAESWLGGKKPRPKANIAPSPPTPQTNNRPKNPPGTRKPPDIFGYRVLSRSAARNIMKYMQRYIWIVSTLIMK